MSLLLIKNGTIITHDKTIYNMDILIEDSKVIEIDTNIEIDNCHIIDAKDKIIIPGLVDMHCEIGEPGYEHRENFETASKSALNGGFTSLTCNPNTSPVVDNKTVVEYIISKAKSECLVNLYPYGSMTKKCEGLEIAEIGEMQLSGIVAVSDGDKAIQDSGLARKIFQYTSMLDIPIITHCEDIQISNNSGVNEGFIATRIGLNGAPATAEIIHLSRNILLAEEFNVHLHITHVSTKESVKMIKTAKKRGVKITAETSPQYFILDETDVDEFNTLSKVNPPLRTREDVEAVKKGLKDGTIDVISSDHKPNTIDSKSIEFDLASFGISSFETAFSLSYTYLVSSKILTIEQLIEKMSYKPASILGINKGKIGIGQDADLVVFDPNSKHEIKSKKFESKARYSPFDNYLVDVNICNTIIKGKNYNV